MTLPRRPRNKNATREDILAVATALFAECDDSQVTVNAICERGNLSTASLYSYFPSKDAIARAVCRTVTQPDMALVDQPLAEGRSPVAVLNDLFLAQARQVQSTPRLAQTVYAYGLHEVCHPGEGEPPPPFLDVLERVVRQGQETGAIRQPPSCQELATMAYCLFATTVMCWTSNPAGASLVDRIQRALHASLDGWFHHDWTTQHPDAAAKARAPLPIPGRSFEDFLRLLDGG